MRQTTKLTLLSLISLTPAHAAVVFVGSNLDDAGTENTRWATTGVPKTFDADGNNQYGSYAHEFIGISNTNAPASVSFVSIGAGNSVVGPFPGYATVDDNAGGSAQVLTTTGPTLSNVITYQYDDPNIATLAPNGIRIGLFVDGLNGNQFTGISHTLEHVRGGGVIGSATANEAPNSLIDAHFFDLTDIQAGDQIRFSTTYPVGAPTVFATFQGYTQDIIPVPEPSTSILFALAGLGLIGRRRR